MNTPPSAVMEAGASRAMRERGAHSPSLQDVQGAKGAHLGEGGQGEACADAEPAGDEVGDFGGAGGIPDLADFVGRGQTGAQEHQSDGNPASGDDLRDGMGWCAAADGGTCGGHDAKGGVEGEMLEEVLMIGVPMAIATG